MTTYDDYTTMLPASVRPSSPRKAAMRDLADRLAPGAWIKRNAYSYEEDYRNMRFLIPEGARVTDLGCRTGRLLAALKPSRGLGVDFSSGMMEVARNEIRAAKA